MQRFSLTANRNSKPKHERPSLRSQHLQQKPSKVISFVGNIQDNVNRIMADIGCCQNCQFRQILLIFAGKMQKLRTDRQSLKQKYIQDVHKLQTKVKMLQQQNNTLKQNISNLLKQQQQQSSYQEQNTLDHFKLLCFDSQPNQQDHDKYQFQYQCKSIKTQNTKITERKQQQISEKDYQSIQKLAFKYNICGDQLEKLITEYLGIQESSINYKEQKKLKSLCEKLSAQREKKQLRNQINLYMRPDKQKIRSKQNYYY